jgi:hypothetical protein
MTCRIGKKQITCNKEFKSGLEGGEKTGNMFIGQSTRARLSCVLELHRGVSDARGALVKSAVMLPRGLGRMSLLTICHGILEAFPI